MMFFFSSKQKKHLVSIIRLQNYLDFFPCIHCLFDYFCIKMLSVSMKCAHCTESNWRDCVLVSWEVVEQTILLKCETIEQNKQLVDEDDK